MSSTTIDNFADFELINKDNYFPLKKLDLKVFLTELKIQLKDFLGDYEGFKIENFYLTGINSSHQNIDKLLESSTNIPVKILRFEEHPYFKSINSKNQVLIQNFNTRNISTSLRCFKIQENIFI